MPVCSFFLRGICTNEACPYSHVNVNHNAAVCSAFLKGYCAEGNNCKLKHTKECQSYNKNGYCPDKLNGRCKLQHNKDSKHGKDIQKKKKKTKEPEQKITETETDSSNLGDCDYFSLVPKFLDETNNEMEEYDEEEAQESSCDTQETYSSSDNEQCFSDNGSGDCFEPEIVSGSPQDLPPPIPDFLKL
eukprot:CAMPEP_0117053946 /NCGR_PEP_ID=MMETSP0472-20121206/37353_1 /TAXON_ID=693140 ORGANISM="Tiarina fusus, Strain LIS" /NCGR_SAMPLE_ID=MMETSP0472 /ASSEMBLY_ACC=CAM_ASM_000603 /LENGTH=187 /DNA_ID=CAMNT_0004769277 /DNA_START=360 /DNA_END=923 /DNA_ORIENTATION=-